MIHKTPTVPIHLVWFDREKRQRRMIETSELEASIAKVGLIQPIILHSSFELIAGERRLEACKKLGWTEIPALFFEAMESSDRKRVELEENVKRKDLPWQDYVLALAEIHEFYAGEAQSWSNEKTALELATTEFQVTVGLQVAEVLRSGDEKIKLCSSLNEAYNVLKRRRGRILDEELNVFAEFVQEQFGEKNDTNRTDGSGLITDNCIGVADSGAGAGSSSVERISSAPVRPQVYLREASDASILQADFLSWAPSYAGPKFNLLHCDFPYGTNVFGGGGQFSGARRQSQDYVDDENTYFQLLLCLEQNLEKLCAQSAHLVFWFSFKYYAATLKLFDNGPLSSFALSPFPLIWHKSDYSAVLGDYRRWPKHSYECALLGSRGERLLVESGFDSYHGPTDPSLHPTTKPEPMLRAFFKSLVDSNTRLLDPTCGSGSAIRAAESLGAKYVLGLERDSEFRARAVTALHTSRLKRAGEK